MTQDIVDAVSARAAIQLTPGRHALVASQIKARFDATESALFGALAAEVETEARRAVALSRTRLAPAGVYGDEARDADTAVDATLSLFDTLLAGYERAHGPETETGRAARALRTRLLPRGLAAIAQASYPDELVQVTALLEDAKRADVVVEVARIPGLGAVLEELAPRAKRLREALDREARDGASYRDVLAATNRTEARLAELVAGIVFHHRGDSADAIARRRHLLEPYATQVGALREAYRRRQLSTDIDPETGAEVPVPTAPAA